MVSIPVVETEVNLSLLNTDEESDVSPTKYQGTIVCVSEDISLYELIHGISSEYNVNVQTFFQGGIALDMLKHTTPDIIFFSTNTSDITVDNFITTIQKNPQLASIDCYLLTNNTDLHRFKNLPVDDVFEFPVDINQLVQVIEKRFNHT